MEKPPVVERHYLTADNFMLTRVSTIIDAFSGDLADFTAFVASYNNTFKTQWQSDYAAALAVLNDETIVDQQKALTETLEAAMAAARNKWTELSFFVKRTFPTSKARRDEFGTDDYRNVRESGMGMTRFMATAHTKAEFYHELLIDKDYTQDKIDEIAALGLAVAAADSAQEDFKKQRRILTEDRIKLLNKPYDRMLEVNEAAQIIYADSAAKLAQYTFNPTGDAFDGPGDYDGSIAPDVSAEVAHVHYRADRLLTFQNTGTSTLQFYLNGGGLDPQGEIVTLPAGATEPRSMESMDATGNHIIVHNAGGVACTYLVTVGA